MAYGLGDVSSVPVIDWPTARDMVYHAPGVVVKTVSVFGGPPQTIVNSDKSPSWVKTAVSVLAKAVHGGRYPIVIAGTSYVLDNPKPTTPPAQGYEWVYSLETGWIQKKKSGGILGAIGSVLGTVGKVAATVAPVAALAIPVVGPAVGIGTAAVSGIASASKTIGVAGGALQSAGSALAPSVPPPMVVPQQGGTPVTVPIVPPGQPVLGTMTPGMPSWVVPVGIGVLVFLLSDRGR